VNTLHKGDDDDDDNNNNNNYYYYNKYQGTAENSCIGHSTHTAGSANIEAQKSLILQTALYAPLTVRTE
jgi:hypothetical protein